MSKDIERALDDKWILSLRDEKNPLDPQKPYAHLLEKERTVSGEIEDILTIFLTNSECPFHCLMCDLWKNTTDHRSKSGDIPNQIQSILEQYNRVDHLKIYNSGNFFDTRAIPVQDYQEIAYILRDCQSVTVECHPKLINERCIEFASMLNPKLEVAIGLETVHPDILPKLNKQMTLEDFEDSVKYLKSNGISTRAFILLRTPFMSEKEGIEWAMKSLDFAFDIGVDVCSVIPTRTGNGALDQLMSMDMFSEPEIESLEKVMEYGLSLKSGRVFADLWDIERFSKCDKCFEARKQRLNEMNLLQSIPELVTCQCQ